MHFSFLPFIRLTPHVFSDRDKTIQINQDLIHDLPCPNALFMDLLSPGFSNGRTYLGLLLLLIL